MTQLCLVLGDQLSLNLPSLQRLDPAKDVVLLVEVRAEATYVKHHKKKIAFLFAAMRHFAEELGGQGYKVDYVKLGDAHNTHSFTGEVQRAIARHKPDALVVTEPGEWRVMEQMKQWETQFGLPVSILPDTRFLCSIPEFNTWAHGRKQLRMEYFYREMRQRHNLLMKGDKPVGGEWNFDKENRKSPPKDLYIPPRPVPELDEITADVLALVRTEFADHFGDLEPFDFAVTRSAAKKMAAHFMHKLLPQFGDYQDAMVAGEAYLYHSVISMYLNCGLLDALELCQQAEAQYTEGNAPLPAVEGFIRQILGWREFIRGVYWHKMPKYAELNELNAKRKLPWFYWSGETDMRCMAEAIGQTKQNAYAHHIQRLMVTGNFALIAGLDPKEVCEWYLLVYADAYEWVELPNTLGMALFADGGVVGSKPYASSGKYINRMSNYCKGCKYSVEESVGDNACPFNALYWHFIERNRARFKTNPRMSTMYATWDRMDAGKRQAIIAQADRFLAGLSHEKES